MFLREVFIVILITVASLAQAAQLRGDKTSNPWAENRKIAPDALNCAVADNAKADCGWTGMVQSQCESQGCCWVPSTKAAWCFYPAPPPPTVKPTQAPTVKPTSSSPTVKPTVPPPTLSPTTTAPTISSKPTFQQTNQPTVQPTEQSTVSPTANNQNATTTAAADSNGSKSSVSVGIVVGAIVGGIVILGAVFVFYVFCQLYEKPAPKVEEKPAEPVEKIGIKLTPYSGSQKTLYSSTYTREENDLYSVFSKGNGSVLSEYVVNRRDFEAAEATEAEDEGSVEFEGITPGGPVRWYEGRDHGFVTP